MPTAEAIRAGDAERLAADVAALASEAAEEDLAAARRLAESRSAIEVAVALVRRDRARRPAPEELPETARAAQETPREPPRSAPRAGRPRTRSGSASRWGARGRRIRAGSSRFSADAAR